MDPKIEKIINDFKSRIPSEEKIYRDILINGAAFIKVYEKEGCIYSDLVNCMNIKEDLSSEHKPCAHRPEKEGEDVKASQELDPSTRTADPMGRS